MSSSAKSVDPSLWWDSFTALLTDLEDASLSSASLPPNLAKKLKNNHAWFLDTVSSFKPPNVISKEALNSPKLQIGAHELKVKPELRDKALHVSSYLCLDEVQSYILVERSIELNGLGLDSIAEEYLHVILLNYYMERQCLLNCTRWILFHAIYIGMNSKEEENIVREELVKLISDGLECKLISVMQDLLSCSNPEEMDVDIFTLWAEEVLIEDNLVLDILFLVYYESLCSCNCETWKKLCSFYKGILSGSYNFGKLAISADALMYISHAKIRLLLILMLALDLENLLKLVHDDIPFRQGASVFSLTDIQQMDALISSFDTLEMREAGPLILTWAVCLCLISSLRGKEENNILMDIDHVAYVRQAFEGASLNSFVQILESAMLKESDGPVAGYRSVLRTFVSAFIASYEINLQLEDNTFNQILGILCKIYRGEESLCIQFWDKQSFIDGPIRCLLCNLEGEFPLRTLELVRLLSSLCEGSWPAECVYNFLHTSVGVSSLFEVTSETFVDSDQEIVETSQPLCVPGVESLIIPRKTRGHILKVVSGNTALVRWEYSQSGLCVLLLRLAQVLYLDSNEEALLTLDLLCQMVSFNKAVAFSLMGIGNSFYFQTAGMNGEIEKSLWVVEIICSVIKNLSPNSSSTAVMSMGVSILAKMLKCAPSRIAAVALKVNIFEMSSKERTSGIDYGGSLSGSWLLSGKLAKMLLIDCEQNDYDKPLAISVLDLTMELVEARVENDLVLALVVFCLQYILVNHEYWKYKVKHVRWTVTLKVLELLKPCIMSALCSEKLGAVIRDLLLYDSSIHNTLCRLVCTTKQSLQSVCVSRLFEPLDIEGYQQAIGSALEILHLMLSKFLKDTYPSIPVFHQVMLSSTTKPIPIVAAVLSLISYSQIPEIQVAAVKVLSMLLITADYLQPYLSDKLCLGLDDKQTTELRQSLKCALLEQLEWKEDLFVATMNLLISAARYQPAFLVAIFSEDARIQSNEAPNGILECKKSSLLGALVPYVERSPQLIKGNPRMLLLILNFLKTLWQGAVHYISILGSLKSSGELWKHFSNCISLVDSCKISPFDDITGVEAQNIAYRYQCQSAIMEIMGCEMFLNKKLYADLLSKESSALKVGTEIVGGAEKSKSANDCKLILSTWCERSIFGNLIKSYTVCEYSNEICHHAKVATSLLVVYLMEKLAAGNAGSLSISILEKIDVTYKNLSSQPAFSELVQQYSQRGYSEGKELRSLILNDLYYQLQGELEGRKISDGPFKELSQYVNKSNCFQIYQHKPIDECVANAKDMYLYDITRIQLDLGLDMWDYTEWKAYKEVAETMLDYMLKVNSVVLLTSSKLSALRALIILLTVYNDNSPGTRATTVGKIPNQVCLSCIDHICENIHAQIDSLAPFLDASEEILDYLSADVELLLHFMRSTHNSLTLSTRLLILKTAGSGLKVLGNFLSSVSGRKVMQLLLLLLLLAMELPEASDKELKETAEVSNICLGLLPIMCNCIANAEHFTLSLTIIDLVLRSLLTPSTWFPVIHRHLSLQHIIVKLEDKKYLSSIPITLKFLLTLARVRGGAEMLLNAGFLLSLRVLFADLLDSAHSTGSTANNGLQNTSDTEIPQQIWGLGLAVVTAMVHSLENSSSCNEIVDNMIPYLFSEKAHMISFYLSAPDFPSDDQDKKRPRTQRACTSLTSLRETEHTLLLTCRLAKQWNSWIKAVRDVDPQLREKSIHLLAFISRGTHRIGESPRRTAPLICSPVLKEDFDLCKKPSFLNCRSGWFALSPLCCVSKTKASNASVSNGINNSASATYFSDMVGLQMYRISFLLLKFLCLEAKGAATRSEEVGFVDLARIPELPMPEILHGLQDQAIVIISDLCDRNKSIENYPEIQSVCILLVQILEMSLYLELCVLQICGIRPVLGRVEDFSKEVKLALKAMERHTFLNASLQSLKQIMSFVYPGLLQSEGF
ncbi:hypothetical protein K2173_012689 [Erythroxylum novogranatense]|uniref:Nucleoporin Nup188 N-terminal domain-containing protein n=1 Tax=Erythroxylum novogranatense TaxID=1862640 RepID=A0AAV8TK35_9ROSI|nr:hypothetical protein K2173_012689 [Erythroxylum novogranatense]